MTKNRKHGFVLVSLFVMTMPAAALVQQGAASLAAKSDVAALKILSAPPPIYPEVARAAHVEGTVVVKATIGTDGAVHGVQYISGPPLLASAAIVAVGQWRYAPLLVGGKPVEISTAISVNFRLGQSAAESQAPAIATTIQDPGTCPAPAAPVPMVQRQWKHGQSEHTDYLAAINTADNPARAQLSLAFAQRYPDSAYRADALTIGVRAANESHSATLLLQTASALFNSRAAVATQLLFADSVIASAMPNLVSQAAGVDESGPLATLDQASQCGTEILDAVPATARAHFRAVLLKGKGFAELERKEYGAAINTLAVAAASSPRDPLLFYWKGVAEVTMPNPDYQSGLNDLAEASVLAPDTAAFAQYLSTVHEHAGGSSPSLADLVAAARSRAASTVDTSAGEQAAIGRQMQQQNAAPQAPNSWTFDYTFPPVGQRFWVEVSSTTWLQVYSTGQLSVATVVGPAVVNGRTGTVLQSTSDSGQIFFPNPVAGQDSWAMLRFTSAGSWQYLGKMYNINQTVLPNTPDVAKAVAGIARDSWAPDFIQRNSALASTAGTLASQPSQQVAAASTLHALTFGDCMRDPSLSGCSTPQAAGRQTVQTPNDNAQQAQQKEQDTQDKIDQLSREINSLQSDAQNVDQRAQDLLNYSNCQPIGPASPIAAIGQAGCKAIDEAGAAKFKSQATDDRNKLADDQAEIARLQGQQVEARHEDASFATALTQVTQQAPQPSIQQTANQESGAIIAAGAGNDAARRAAAQSAAAGAMPQQQQAAADAVRAYAQATAQQVANGTLTPQQAIAQIQQQAEQDAGKNGGNNNRNPSAPGGPNPSGGAVKGFPKYIAFAFSLPLASGFQYVPSAAPNDGFVGADGAWGVSVETVAQLAIDDSRKQCAVASQMPTDCGGANGGWFPACNGTTVPSCWAALAISNDGTRENWATGEAVGFQSEDQARATALAHCGRTTCKIVWSALIDCTGAGGVTFSGVGVPPTRCEMKSATYDVNWAGADALFVHSDLTAVLVDSSGNPSNSGQFVQVQRAGPAPKASAPTESFQLPGGVLDAILPGQTLKVKVTPGANGVGVPVLFNFCGQ